jgi:hypothetical protein
MKIPYNRDLIIALAVRAKAGANAIGTAVGLAQHNAARITADLEDQIGEAGSLTNTGKQGQYNQKHVALTAARAIRRDAIADGRKLCAAAVDGLKAHLGRTWNPQWTAAGFSGNTIAVSTAHVIPRLFELRNYYRVNPTREVTSEGLTAVAIEAKLALIEAAEHGRDAALSDFRDARDARDLSAQNLKSRMSGLQEELGRLLSDADNRWTDFGFTRPIDGPMPARVQGVTATPGLPGAVLVQWEASPRAINYRVSWSLVTSGAEITEVGLFTDLAANLSGLPTGTTIAIHVTARNNAGETPATIVETTVP